jgi:hypothetical protein
MSHFRNTFEAKLNKLRSHEPPSNQSNKGVIKMNDVVAKLKDNEDKCRKLANSGVSLY